MSLELRGPYRWVKKHKMLVDIAHKTILSGSLEFGGQHHILEENNLTISDGRNSGQLYMYHSYRFLDASGMRCCGRWYNLYMQPTDFTLSPEGEFCYELPVNEDEATYEDVGPAVVRLQLTQKAVNSFQQAIEEA